MLRWFLSIVVLLSATAPAAMGHFMFVVPQSDARKARLVFSETLEPDESVNVKPLAGAVLTVRAAGAPAEERLSLFRQIFLNARARLREKTGTVRTYKVLADGRRQIGAFYVPGDVFGLESGARHAFSFRPAAALRVYVKDSHRMNC